MFEADAPRAPHLYTYLGIRSDRSGFAEAEATMPLDERARAAFGVRLGPFGLALEQAGGSVVLQHANAVPTAISIHLCDECRGIADVRCVATPVRLGKRVMLTAGLFTDAADHTRVVAFGTVTWMSIGASPSDSSAHASVDRAAQVPEVRRDDVIDALRITALEDGSGCRLDEVSAEIAAPGGALHAGVIQLIAEEAALVTARRLAGPGARATRCEHHLLQSGRRGPFIASALELHRGDSGVELRAEVRDRGDDDRLIAASYVRVESP